MMLGRGQGRERNRALPQACRCLGVGCEEVGRQAVESEDVMRAHRAAWVVVVVCGEGRVLRSGIACLRGGWECRRRWRPSAPGLISVSVCVRARVGVGVGGGPGGQVAALEESLTAASTALSRMQRH